MRGSHHRSGSATHHGDIAPRLRYKLGVNMEHKTKPVKVGSQTIGDGSVSVWAGPCSVESFDQFKVTAALVKSLGAAGLRGGLFKLRTDPESFQGLGDEALKIAKKVKAEVEMPFVSEITDPRQVEAFDSVVDGYQIGSRNMHNYSLLKELSQVRKPIFLKRGFSATFKEWMLAADYLIKGGNSEIVLIERGIRTFETSTRNTFDINAIALAKAETDFPILADPSHGTGRADLVTPVAMAAIAAGADGLLIEVHPKPSEALSDGYQSLDFGQFGTLMLRLNRLIESVREFEASP